MKKLIFLLFIIISCSKEDIITDDNNIKDDDKDNPIKQDTTTTTSPSSSFNVIGQWVFNTVQSGGINIEGSNIRSDNHLEGDSLNCDIHSIIFKADSSFNLYTGNYVLFGNYDVLLDTTEQDTIKTITLFIDNKEIGKITDAETDTTFLEGSFDFPELCVELQEGYQDSVYTEGLTYIPDDIFEQYLIDQGFDDYMDDYMVTSNVENKINIGIDVIDKCQAGNCDIDEFLDFDSRFENRMSNLSGIEAFESLTHVNIIGHKVDSINLTQNTELMNFYANFNEFKAINTDENWALRNFSIDANKPKWDVDNLDNPGDTVTKVNFTKNPNLEMLSVPGLGLTSLDLSNNYLITFLDLYNNNLTSIDLSALKELTELRIQYNKLTSIDLSENTKLKKLMILNNDLQGTLDVSMLEDLEELHIVSNPDLTCVKVSQKQLDNINAGYLPGWENPMNVPHLVNCN